MNVRGYLKKFEKKFNSPVDKLRIENVTGKRDHHYFKIFYDGKVVAIHKVSRGSGEWRNPLLGLMSNELGISKTDLTGIEACTFWGKDFIAKSRLVPRD